VTQFSMTSSDGWRRVHRKQLNKSCHSVMQASVAASLTRELTSIRSTQCNMQLLISLLRLIIFISLDL